MSMTIKTLLTGYPAEIQKIYGLHLKSAILYGSYARGDYTPESDVDIGTRMDVKEGIAFKRHKDTLSYFNKNYISTEIFPRELGRKIVKAEEIRHASDYDTFYIASKEVTEQQIKTAEMLLELAKKHLEIE